jgi:general secretion pathway protein G
MKNQRGFTLIELMIVVAIISILAAILIPNFTHARAQAQTAACEANLREIATAFELYYADNQQYPAGANATIGANTISKNGVNYLNTVPQDPSAATTGALYTWNSATTSNPPSYTITCPGLHDPQTLTKIANGVTTNTHLTYTSGAGLATAP